MQLLNNITAGTVIVTLHSLENSEIQREISRTLTGNVEKLIHTIVNAKLFSLTIDNMQQNLKHSSISFAPRGFN